MASAADDVKNPGTRRLFRRHVPRPRLTRLLESATSQVILITGPAGYGKTTLASEWLQGREDVVWYRATPGSADLAAFSAGLSDVLQPIVPGAGERLKQRLRVGESPEKAARPLAELLAEDIAAWPENALLVIDDYHLVADSGPVEEFMDWLLLLSPIRCVVTSRRKPKWASARRVLHGELTEIGSAQLALTHAEAADVLGGRSSESIRDLVTRAEGWPALIGLAALCASSEVPEERVSDELFRYFAEEVLRQETPETQDFMLRASLLPVTSRAACQAVFGLPNADALITDLAHKGLLHDASMSGEYRFHPLLREFLRWKLQTENSNSFRALASDVITFCRSQGDWDSGFELASTTEQPSLLAGLVGDASRDLFAAGRLETVEKWLELAGPAAMQETSAILTRAEALIRRGRMAAGEALAATVCQTLDSDPHLSRAWALRGEARHLISQYDAALGFHLRARKLAEHQEDLLRALWGAFLAATVLETADSTALLDELEQTASQDLDHRLRIATGRVIAAAHEGSYLGLLDSIEPFLPLVEQASDPLVKTSFLARAADLFIARSSYRDAKQQAAKAVDLCQALHLGPLEAFCVEVRAGAEMGLKEFRLARRSLRELEAARLQSEDPHLDLSIKIMSVKLALSESRLFHPGTVLLDSVSSPQRSTVGEFLSLLAIAAAARGDAEGARSLCDQARGITKGVDAQCYASSAEAIVAAAQSDTSLPSILATWVQSSRERGFEHGVVLAYRAYPKLLAALLETPSTKSYVADLVFRAGDRRLARSMGLALPDATQSPRGGLTARELDVLSLLAEGLSNREIAQRLYISVGTTKVHVHHILEKTGARSRLEAAVKAHEILG